MSARVKIEGNRLRRALDRDFARQARETAEWMADRQREYTRSRRIYDRGIVSEHGRDERGHYARAGVRDTRGNREPWWFWYFEEFGTRRSQKWPFVRPALWNHTAEIARILLGKG